MEIIMFSDQKDVFTSSQKEFIKEKTKGKKIAYIASSSDFTRKYFNQTLKFYEQFEIQDMKYIDLDEEYIKSFDKILEEADIIHLAGGKVNHFAKNINLRKYDILIKNAIEQGKMAIGVSAGGLVMGPDLKITKIYEKVQSDEYENPMNIVDFVFVPHIEKVEKSLHNIDIDYKIQTCKDSEILYVTDKETKFII